MTWSQYLFKSLCYEMNVSHWAATCTTLCNHTLRSATVSISALGNPCTAMITAGNLSFSSVNMNLPTGHHQRSSTLCAGRGRNGASHEGEGGSI